VVKLFCVYGLAGRWREILTGRGNTHMTAPLLPLSHNTVSSPSLLPAKLWSMHQIRLQLILQTISQQRSLSPSISLQLALFGATSKSNHSTSHTHQFCQLANNRPGWTARDQYKRDQFSKLWPFTAHYTRSTHQQRNNQLRHIKKEEPEFDSPTTMPRGPGTPQLSRGNAASSTRPTPAPATTIRHGPPISLSRASRQHILARGRPDASSLDSSSALHHWREASSIHKTKDGILATALGDCMTT